MGGRGMRLMCFGMSLVSKKLTHARWSVPQSRCLTWGGGLWGHRWWEGCEGFKCCSIKLVSKEHTYPNPNPSCKPLSTCREYEEPQQPHNNQLDSLLDEEFRRRYVASHDRPALEDCTEEDFEADLCEFLRCRQEPALAKAVTEHRITW